MISCDIQVDHLTFNTPTQGSNLICHKPNHFMHCQCFDHGKGFIRMFALMFVKGQYSNLISHATTISRIEWWCMLMCFVLLWCTRFLIRASFPWLLVEMVVVSFWLETNLLKNLCSQIASHLACDVAIYSTLVLDSAIVGCFSAWSSDNDIVQKKHKIDGGFSSI